MSELEKEIKERITSYAWDVVEGKILACQNIILACKRFIAFLQRDDMYFDIEEVEKTIRFLGSSNTLQDSTTAIPSPCKSGRNSCYVASTDSSGRKMTLG